MATCTICDTRKGKRYCASSGEGICPQCCATEREVTINCPYTCSYLRESRLHEKRELDETQMPYRDVKVDKEFLDRADIVLMLLSAFFNRALQPVPNATDGDARKALHALVTGFQNGAPEPPDGEIAAGIVERFREKMDIFSKDLKDREAGVFSDRVFLGVLVFMARVASGYDNGKPRSRAYIHYLRSTFPDGAE